MSFDRLNRHTELVNTMADRLGLDLVESTLRGHLQPDQMRSRVYRCMGCAHASDCEKLLADVETLDTPPAYCRNKDEFLRTKSFG